MIPELGIEGYVGIGLDRNYVRVGEIGEGNKINCLTS